jgi:hypothetical protein
MLCFCDYRAVFSVNWDSNEQISKSSSSSITIGCACTRRWAIDLPKSSSNRSKKIMRQAGVFACLICSLFVVSSRASTQTGCFSEPGR